MSVSGALDLGLQTILFIGEIVSFGLIKYSLHKCVHLGPLV